MEEFVYKNKEGITALSASFTDFRYKIHSHKEYAVGVTLKGIQNYRLSGCEQHSYPSGVMLFNPEQPHDGMAQDRIPLDYVMLYIDPDLFHQVLGKKETPVFSTPIVYNGSLQKMVLDLASAVLKEGAELQVNEHLVNLSEGLFPSLFESEDKKDHSKIIIAKEMINSSLDSVVNLDEISSELGISKFKFIRMFKDSLGISPYQYYLSSKISRAKQILDRTGDVYSAVADCGFVDLSHLNKHFKTVFGVTAYKYVSEISG